MSDYTATERAPHSGRVLYRWARIYQRLQGAATGFSPIHPSEGDPHVSKPADPPPRDKCGIKGRFEQCKDASFDWRTECLPWAIKLLYDLRTMAPCNLYFIMCDLDLPSRADSPELKDCFDRLRMLSLVASQDAIPNPEYAASERRSEASQDFQAHSTSISRIVIKTVTLSDFLEMKRSAPLCTSLPSR